MKLIPGKLYRLKSPIWFYPIDNNTGGINTGGMKYYSGTKVMYIGFTKSIISCELWNVYDLKFIVRSKILYYEFHTQNDEIFEVSSENLEEIS